MSEADNPKRSPTRHPDTGLVIRPGKAKYPRPAAGFSGETAPAARAVELTPLSIESHRALVARQRTLADRVAAHPDLSVMLLINPVLAFRELGVELSAEMAHHVLHAIQHPPELRNRRDELEASLKKTLGESPLPTDPAWNARLLFQLRKLKPLAIGEQKPAYTPPLGQTEFQGLNKLRPKGGVRYPQPRLLPPLARVSSVPWKESLRRIDLTAPAPVLPTIDVAPAVVPLEDLWFYKDLDPVVHDALELGVIQRRAFPIHSPDSFRKIQSGEKPNAFRKWVKSVRFNPAS